MVEIDEKQVFSLFQKANETGKIKIGANEVTKAVERGQAKLVVSATDVSPAEIVAHFEGLCKEMKIVYLSAGSKAELGALVQIKSTTALAIVDAGSGKKELEALTKEVFAGNKKEDKKEESADESSEEKEE
ncbi:MAG: ribosomal L7Ae/L30e/S12e/Gadd45 family protein [Nanoarchaeota archaeon]|nr:ribosomal L7Ae/L30e/S12e/Gadd45 family protein [Nanoarchaeota archaeon]